MKLQIAETEENQLSYREGRGGSVGTKARALTWRCVLGGERAPEALICDFNSGKTLNLELCLHAPCTYSAMCVGRLFPQLHGHKIQQEVISHLLLKQPHSSYLLRTCRVLLWLFFSCPPRMRPTQGCDQGAACTDEFDASQLGTYSFAVPALGADFGVTAAPGGGHRGRGQGGGTDEELDKARDWPGIWAQESTVAQEESGSLQPSWLLDPY